MAYTEADAAAARERHSDERRTWDRKLGRMDFIGAPADTWGAPNWKRAEIWISDWDNGPSLSIVYFATLDQARKAFGKIRAQIRDRVAAGYTRAGYRFSITVFCDVRGKVYDGSIR